MARPRIEINWVEFDKLCGIQCTLREIASWFECSEDTIERAVEREKEMRFADYFEQKKGKGKISLRRKQYEVAMSGDRSMLIWLGKQYLNQSDKLQQEQTVSHSADIKMEVSDLEERINQLKGNKNNGTP